MQGEFFHANFIYKRVYRFSAADPCFLFCLLLKAKRILLHFTRQLLYITYQILHQCIQVVFIQNLIYITAVCIQECLFIQCYLTSDCLVQENKVYDSNLTVHVYVTVQRNQRLLSSGCCGCGSLCSCSGWLCCSGCCGGCGSRLCCSGCCGGCSSLCCCSGWLCCSGSCCGSRRRCSCCGGSCSCSCGFFRNQYADRTIYICYVYLFFILGNPFKCKTASAVLLFLVEVQREFIVILALDVIRIICLTSFPPIAAKSSAVTFGIL